MEIDAIKKKVLEDVDPETQRKKKKEMQHPETDRDIAVPGDSSSGDPDLLYTDGNLDC